MLGVLTCIVLTTVTPDPVLMSVNAQWENVPEAAQGDYRAILRVLGQQMQGAVISISGVRITAARLSKWSRIPTEESLEQQVRQSMRRPLKLEGFHYFVDDVLNLPPERLAKAVVLTSFRGRKLAVLMHPEEVFENKIRRYPNDETGVNIDKPATPRFYSPAKNGQLLGPQWTARFPNPRGERAKFSRLREMVPGYDFHKRISSLVKQFRAQGAEAYVDSTVRSKERGYLIWGSYVLSQVETKEGYQIALAELNAARIEWKLHVPVVWQHSAGWRAGVESARTMAETYGVTYATREGARASNHYDGLAVDMTVVGLPSTVTPLAPDGEKRTFNLSDPEHSRDLSLSPELIAWIEQKYRLVKLKLDYPHWDDVRAVVETP